jgi:hypothetical protein
MVWMQCLIAGNVVRIIVEVRLLGLSPVAVDFE